MKAKVNNKYAFTLSGSETGFDRIEVKEGIFHILKNNRSYTAEVLQASREEKTFIIRVNGNKYTVQLKDKYDELLEKLGMNYASGQKVKEVKAPMPGLVVDVKVKEGDTVKQGDGLLVLQAMKMENIIKSPAEGTVKKISVKKGDAIEKNQVMVNFA